MKLRGPSNNDYVDRDCKPKAMVFTERDGRILEHIHQYDGFLADYQVLELEFQGVRQTKMRLGKLFHNGYLERVNRRGSIRFGCSIYWLAPKGAKYVADKRGEEWRGFRYLKQPRWSKVEHDLQTNDFTIMVQKACLSNPDLELYEWVSDSVFRADQDEVEYTLLNGKKTKRRVIPDRYFRVDRAAGDFVGRLLLELDNATHPNQRFADQKVLPYTAYLRTDAYRRRFGSNTGRWLVVTTSLKRLEYLRDTTTNAAGKNARLWHFTTFDQVRVETVLTEPIWLPAGEDEKVALFPKR
jgi:hypothetical protein